MYPIHKLDRNVTHTLHDIISADVEGNINKGLQNQIDFIDEDSHITDVCEIVQNAIDGTCKVKLSSAFCQFFWFLSDICLKEIDLSIIKEECRKVNADIKDYKKEVEQILQHPMQYIWLMIQQYPGIPPQQYLDYLQRSLQLLDEKSFAVGQRHELQMAVSILDKTQLLNLNAISNTNIDGLYEQKVNSVYCFGIAFVLLHELSHFALGHMEKPEEEKEDEVNADLAAFWSIYSDINDNRRFSANIGIICMLFSLLVLNPTMQEDGVHPREDQRMFEIFDNIKDENPKYTVLLVRLFTIWAKLFNISNFPQVEDDGEVSLQIIREYLRAKVFE